MSAVMMAYKEGGVGPAPNCPQGKPGNPANTIAPRKPTPNTPTYRQEQKTHVGIKMGKPLLYETHVGGVVEK